MSQVVAASTEEVAALGADTVAGRRIGRMRDFFVVVHAELGDLLAKWKADAPARDYADVSPAACPKVLGSDVRCSTTTRTSRSRRVRGIGSTPRWSPCTSTCSATSWSTALAGSEVVVAMRERTPFDRALLDRPRTALLVTTGMANASIDLDAARERGVCRAAPAAGRPAGRADLGARLAVTRRVAYRGRAVRPAAGGNHDRAGAVRPDARRARLGRLGSIVAGLAGRRDAGARLERDLDPATPASSASSRSALDDLLTPADVVSVDLKLSDRSRGLLGARELDLIGSRRTTWSTPPASPIVGRGRAGEALRSGRIAGAGLDVFEVEPLPADHPLRTVPRAVLTRTSATSRSTQTGSSTPTRSRTSSPGSPASRSAC